jgi:predicted phosphate transport protein (TIGR00153 family)
MLIFKKEKAARKLALEHFKMTHDCLQSAIEVMEHYMAGDIETAKQLASEVIKLESEADTLKHELRDVLFSGAFLPNIRSDVYRLVDTVDKIADMGETSSHFVVYQRPVIPEYFHADMNEICRLCMSCYSELQQALKCFFKPKGEIELLREHASKVCELETQVDGLQADFTRKIFESEMGMGEKIHLCQLLKYVGRIADRAEDAADELQFAAMKSVM